MNNLGPISRRKFLMMLSAIGLLGPSSVSGMDWANDQAIPSRTPGLILELPHKSAQRIGQAYFAIKPGEKDLEMLMSLLVNDDPAILRAVEDCDPTGLKAVLRQRCSDDFELGRTTQLEGWVVSLTEARLCAFQALYSTASGSGSNRC